jgi:hypothetical protein
MENQNPQETFGNNKVSIEEGNRDTNTPMQEGDGESEITTRSHPILLPIEGG